MAEEYYNIGPLASGLDFYSGGIEAVCFIFAESTVTTNTYAIKYAQSDIGITATVNTASTKIAYGYPSSDITSTVIIGSIRIINPIAHSDSVVSVSVSAMKIAKSSTVIGSVLTPSFFAIKTTKAHTDIAISASSQILVGKIVKALSSSNIASTVDFSVKEINLASSAINIIVRSNINQPLKFSPSFIDYSSIRTFLLIDNKPITNHNRQLDVSLSPSYIENRNWNNTKSRYYKTVSSSGRKTFSLSWNFLPNFMEKTVDTRHGRDYIASVSEDPDVHVLKIINQDEDGITPYTEVSYNVFVRSYSETLIRRDLSDGVYYFDCSLTLEEA